MIDNSSYKVLKHLYKKDREGLSVLRDLVHYDGDMTFGPQIASLMEDKLIAQLQDQETPSFRITIKGRAYVEQKKRDRLNFWLPYSITTILAVISLCVAVAGLLR